jgi:hypothetical protein
MDLEYEIHREGLTRTVKIKSHSYDLIEFTIRQKLVSETGKEITNSGHTSFFQTKEFVEFFGPIVNEMKVRLDNGIPNSIQE